MAASRPTHRWGPRRQRARLVALALAACGEAVLASMLVGEEGAGGAHHRPRHAAWHPAARRGHRPLQATGSSPPGAAGNPTRHITTIGYSADHRPIRLIVIGDPRARHPALVVGCVHGNETAGIAVARRLAAGPPPRGTALWIIPDLNPDGVAAGTRQNAHGVDLNRNLPYRWRRHYAPGDPQYGGPGPLSEPESAPAHTLILRVVPRVSIWFHQPQALTDGSGAELAGEHVAHPAVASPVPPRGGSRRACDAMLAPSPVAVAQVGEWHDRLVSGQAIAADIGNVGSEGTQPHAPLQSARSGRDGSRHR